MHRGWLCDLLVVGLMMIFGTGAAAIALSDPAPDNATVMLSLAGGILFGALIGLGIVFSRAQTYPRANWRDAPPPRSLPAPPEPPAEALAMSARTPAPRPEKQGIPAI